MERLTDLRWTFDLSVEHLRSRPRAYFTASACLALVILSLTSCFAWVLLLSGAGYFSVWCVIESSETFNGWQGSASYRGGCIAGFYFAERFWLSKKVEEADPERLQELEQAAQEKLLQGLGRSFRSIFRSSNRAGASRQKLSHERNPTRLSTQIFHLSFLKFLNYHSPSKPVVMISRLHLIANEMREMNMENLFVAKSGKDV